MRRKRTSKRRWKKRAKLGRPIPAQIIFEHKLEHWCRWYRPLDFNVDAYMIEPPPSGFAIDRTPQRWWKVPLA